MTEAKLQSNFSLRICRPGAGAERCPSGAFAEGESEAEAQWGSERPENSPVGCFQRRTGGSPGQGASQAAVPRMTIANCGPEAL